MKTYLVKYRIQENESVNYSERFIEAQSDLEAENKAITDIPKERGIDGDVRVLRTIECSYLRKKIEEAVTSQFPLAGDEEKYNIAFLAISNFYD